MIWHLCSVTTISAAAHFRHAIQPKTTYLSRVSIVWQWCSVATMRAAAQARCRGAMQAPDFRLQLAQQAGALVSQPWQLACCLGTCQARLHIAASSAVSAALLRPAPTDSSQQGLVMT